MISGYLKNAAKEEKNPESLGNRIILRTVARDLQSMVIQDENGNQLSFEDWEYQNKYISYKDFKWTEENII